MLPLKLAMVGHNTAAADWSRAALTEMVEGKRRASRLAPRQIVRDNVY
jgi:hypothetical protein